MFESVSESAAAPYYLEGRLEFHSLPRVRLSFDKDFQRLLRRHADVGVEFNGIKKSYFVSFAYKFFFEPGWFLLPDRQRITAHCFYCGSDGTLVGKKEVARVLPPA